MKRLFFLLIGIMLPVLTMAQGHKGSAAECAPMKDGKVCYTDQEEVAGKTQEALFETLGKWARKHYGKDVFISSVSTNKAKKTLFVGSKVELLLNDTDKTILKYKMHITCHNEGYDVKVTDISYQYDPENDKRFKTYPAEDVIANNGKSNTIAIIKNPRLFCDATFFFVENLFGDISIAAEEE